MTQQPEWKYVGHIGDVDPIAYGGGFIYVDTTGVYPPELTWFEPAPDEEWHKTEGQTPLQIYRLQLEPPRFKTLTDTGRRTTDSSKGLPSSQRGDTWEWAEEWFVGHLESVATSAGTTKFRLLRELFSREPMVRARAYETMIHHHGPFEFDQYPITLTENEAYDKYASEMTAARVTL